MYNFDSYENCRSSFITDYMSHVEKSGVINVPTELQSKMIHPWDHFLSPKVILKLELLKSWEHEEKWSILHLLVFVPKAYAQTHMLFMITRLPTSSNDGVFDHSDPRGFPL